MQLVVAFQVRPRVQIWHSLFHRNGLAFGEQSLGPEIYNESWGFIFCVLLCDWEGRTYLDSIASELLASLPLRKSLYWRPPTNKPLMRPERTTIRSSLVKPLHGPKARPPEAPRPGLRPRANLDFWSSRSGFGGFPGHGCEMLSPALLPA